MQREVYIKCSRSNAGSNSSGNIGIGTDSIEGKLEIEHTGSWDNPSIHLKGEYPTIKFNDTTTNDADDWYLYVNSNNFYILVDRDASGEDNPIDDADNKWETPHPFILEGDTNKGYLFRERNSNGRSIRWRRNLGRKFKWSILLK